jgi:hypothetical protein
MTDTDKVRENRLRRMAARQGLELQKSRLRDHRAIGFGTYQLLNPTTSTVIVANDQDYGLTLDDIERELTS